MTHSTRLKDSQTFAAPLTTLIIDPPKEDGYAQGKRADIKHWKQLASELGAEFVQQSSNNHTVAGVIANQSKQRYITQIVLGQTARSRWEKM